jgi:hypothetical protein
MNFHQQRLADIARTRASIAAQYNELNRMRDLYRKAQLLAQRSRRIVRRKRVRT